MQFQFKGVSSQPYIHVIEIYTLNHVQKHDFIHQILNFGKSKIKNWPIVPWDIVMKVYQTTIRK